MIRVLQRNAKLSLFRGSTAAGSIGNNLQIAASGSSKSIDVTFTTGSWSEQHLHISKAEAGYAKQHGVHHSLLSLGQTRAFHTSKHCQSAAESKHEVKPGADPVWNWPNGISMARLLSGPAIAYLILDTQWSLAFTALAVSGASDWLDGFVARRYNQGSVLGSYLDPLADKVLICCVTGALAYEGSLYAPLAWLIIGRDVFLVCGAFVLRFRALNWTYPGFSEFFRTTNAPQPLSGKAHTAGAQNIPASPSDDTQSDGANSHKSSNQGANRSGGEASSSEAAPFVTPLYISKVNTVAQLALLGSCITSSWYAWPSETVILSLGGLTAALTCFSGFEYYRTRRTE